MTTLAVVSLAFSTRKLQLAKENDEEMVSSTRGSVYKQTIKQVISMYLKHKH